jgi:hypothetical protein
MPDVLTRLTRVGLGLALGPRLRSHNVLSSGEEFRDILRQPVAKTNSNRLSGDCVEDPRLPLHSLSCSKFLNPREVENVAGREN